MPKKEKIYTKILRFRVTKETYNWLKKMSKKFKVDVSKIIRIALDTYMMKKVGK